MIKSTLYIIGFALIALLLSACASTNIDNVQFSGKQGYTDLIKMTRQRLLDARSVGGEWLDTEWLVTQAEIAARRAHYENAIKLAREAYFQADQGYRQQVEQKNRGNPIYLLPK